MRLVLSLADRAEQRIRDAGQEPPERPVLIAALWKAARKSARASRMLEQAVAWEAAAVRGSVAAAHDALSAADEVADNWVAGEQERVARDRAEFDAITAAQLADVDTGQSADGVDGDG